jgi:hypothetical protein
MVSQDNQLDGFTGHVLVVTGESPTKQTKGVSWRRAQAQLLLLPLNPLSARPPQSSLFQPRAAMAASQFQKIQIQREGTVSTPPSILTSSLV